MGVEILDLARVASAKRAFTTRRVPIEEMRTLIVGTMQPDPGDLVLASIDTLGKHKRIELPDGRRSILFPGDEIVVCFGNRYAPDQFEAVIGNDLSSCDLVAGGGIASCELSRHSRMSEPTQITPIGLVGDRAGKRLNVRNFSLPAVGPESPPIVVVLSVGTSMNAGKTLTATSLVRGLKASGFRVAGIKATGTGSGGDLWIMRDAGADVVLDFTDVGFASTYLAKIDELEEATFRLIKHAAMLGCEAAMIEIADGLQQLETAALIRSERLRRATTGVVFAAYDAMGAKYGVDTLQAVGHQVIALSGRLSQSPLGMREAESATGLRVYTPWELQEGALVERIMGGRRAAAVAPVLPTAIARSRKSETALATRLPSVPLLGVSHGQFGVTRSSVSENTFISEPQAEARVVSREAALELISIDRSKENGPDTAFLREVLSVVARHVMMIETNALCGASTRVRSAERITRRNGYRRRQWNTCVGAINLDVPRLRKGAYRPGFLPACSVDRATLEAVANDVSESSGLTSLINALGMASLPEAEMSRLRAEIEARTNVGIPSTQSKFNGEYFERGFPLRPDKVSSRAVDGVYIDIPSFENVDGDEDPRDEPVEVVAQGLEDDDHDLLDDWPIGPPAARPGEQRDIALVGVGEKLNAR